MNEYNVTFRKVIVGDEPDIFARVSATDEVLVNTVETIRSGIVAGAKNRELDLSAIPNGHFMEVEFLLEGRSIQGVVFMTPYLPDKFMAIIREVLAEVGIQNVY